MTNDSTPSTAPAPSGTACRLAAALAVAAVTSVLAVAPTAASAAPAAPAGVSLSASPAPAGDAASADARRRRVPRTDAITAHHGQLGGVRGLLGAPVGGRVAVAGGQVQHYVRGDIYWSPATGAWEVHGALLVHYRELGGPAGPLGFPVTDEQRTPDGIGSYNHFARGGSLYWSPGTGAHAVQGAIRDRWAALGWEGGVLGYPVTDELATPDRIGRYTHFARGGSVYWSPGTGAHAVLGGVRARWAALGWEGGVLGYPVTDELATPDRVGRYTHFSRGGSIYWSPATGPWSVRGAIRDRWASLGWERGVLGYPVSDEQPVPGGQRSWFTGGSVTWTAADGRTTVTPRPTAPAAVTGLVATPGDGSAELHFTAPRDGGSPITGWQRSVAGGAWLPLPVVAGAGTARSATVTGLANGLQVSVAVRAVNAVGPGAASAVRVTPAAAVHAPGVDEVLATAGNGAARLELHVGPGDRPTGFQVGIDGQEWVALPITPLVREDGATGWSSAVVGGLENGRPHSLVVRALVGAVPGLASDAVVVTPQAPVPVTAPAAVTDLAAGESGDDVLLTFSAPDDGGSPITGYAYRVDGGPWHPLAVVEPGDGSPARSATVAGLPRGGTYGLEVQASNTVGASTSNRAEVTLAPVAGAPARITDLTGTAGDASAVLAFSAPADAAGLTYSWSADGETWRPLTVSEVPGQAGRLAGEVTGLRNDVPVTLVVRAEDGSLAGPASNGVTLLPKSGGSS